MLVDLARLIEIAVDEALSQRTRNLAQHCINQHGRELESYGLDTEWLAAYRAENNAQRRVDAVRLERETLDEWPTLKDSEGHTEPLDIPEPAPAPPPGVERTPERLEADYQENMLDHIQRAQRRGVITQTQALALQAWGRDATLELAGVDMPSASKRKHGVNIDHAFAQFKDFRADFNRRLAPRGFKPIPRIKRKDTFVQLVLKAQAAMEADRLNPAPEPSEPGRCFTVYRAESNH